MPYMNRRGILVAAAAAALSACGGGGDDSGDGIAHDSPGKISGLGQDKGKVKGAQFALPAGIESVKGWMGLYMGLSDVSTSTGAGGEMYPLPLNPAEPLKGAKAVYENSPMVLLQGDPVQKIVGCGIGVTVRVPLVNRTAAPVEVVFPAGLVLPSKLSMYQSGVLLAETRVVVEAGADAAVALATLGGNWHLAGSTPGALYEPGVVSSSATLQELVELLRDKRLSYEHYEGEYAAYWEIVMRLQEMLSNLTDSSLGLTAADRAWIQALPNHGNLKI